MARRIESERKRHLSMSEEKPEAPDIYCDGMSMRMTPFDVALEFSKKTVEKYGGPTKTELVVTVRMSPQHAKVMAILLKKNILEFERQAGKINLHPGMLKELGISETEDW